MTFGSVSYIIALSLEQRNTHGVGVFPNSDADACLNKEDVRENDGL